MEKVWCDGNEEGWKRGWVEFSTQAETKPSSQTGEEKMERKCFIQRIYYFIPYNYNLFYHFFYIIRI